MQTSLKRYASAQKNEMPQVVCYALYQQGFTGLLPAILRKRKIK